MVKKTLHNPSDKDIIDYRIEEVRFDEAGNVMLDKEGQPAKTGRTLEWSLKAGETLEFPDYVADYLVGIYAFLKVTGVKEETTEPKTSTSTATPTTGSINCKLCGAHFKNLKAIGLHYAARHSEVLLNG